VPQVGALAPDFTLPSTSGEKVTLSALRGKPVLIAFFPLAFSSTCTAELCELRDDHDQFASRGVTVLPIYANPVAANPGDGPPPSSAPPDGTGVVREAGGGPQDNVILCSSLQQLPVLGHCNPA